MNQMAPQVESTPAYPRLFNLIKQAMFVVRGETGIIRDANPAAEALTGELKGMHRSQLHPSDEEEQSRQIFAELVRAPAALTQPTTREWNILHRDGRRIPVDILSEVFAGSDGKPLVFGIFRANCTKNRNLILRPERRYSAAPNSVSRINDSDRS